VSCLLGYDISSSLPIPWGNGWPITLHKEGLEAIIKAWKQSDEWLSRERLKGIFYLLIVFVKLHVHAILNDNLGGHSMTHFGTSKQKRRTQNAIKKSPVNKTL
jgi:hypothetical protein